MGSASRVGALVVLFVAMAVGLYAFLGKGIWAQTNEYTVVFDDAGGLNRGAQVLLSGVNVGTVSDVGFTADGKPRAKIQVRKEISLNEGTTALLPGSLVGVGDKVIQLQLPTKPGGVLRPNDPSVTIPGHLQGPLEGMLPDSKQTIIELNKTMVAFRQLLEDPELKGNINHLMQASAVTADKFGGTAQRVNGLIDSNQAKLTAVMSSVQTSMKNLEVVSLQVRKIATDPELEASTKKLLKDLDAAILSGQKLVTDLNAVTADPETQANLKQTTANVRDMTASGAKVAADFEKVSPRFEAIGKNVEDISKNGAETSAKINELVGKANKLADQVEKLLEDAKGALGKVSEKRNLVPDFTSSADLFHESDPDRFRTDFNVGFSLAGQKYTMGLYDAFESNKLNFQLARPIGSGADLRYGVYASKPGLGLDYSATPALGFRADLFGLNKTQLDVRARYNFGGGIHGWLGVDRVFDRNTPSIGIGVGR